MKRTILATLVLASFAAHAQTARTYGYEIDDINPLMIDRDTPYDVFNDARTLEDRYEHGSSGEHVAAEAQPALIDMTYNGIRIYAEGLDVEATIDGNCDVLTPGTHFSFHDVKVFDSAGHIIGPATGTPPIGDTYHFDGGTVTFNFVEVGENTADIAGIVLLFDSGESHTFAYAKAGFACPTSVELQGFTIE